MADLSNIHYENPPLIEVVCGIRFEPIEALKLPHLGFFWKDIRNKFPTCEYANPLHPATINQATNLPNPRIWLVSQKREHLIQLESNKFFFNWRKESLSLEYPHFDQVKERFLGYFEMFKNFLNKENLGIVKPLSYELTYINHIQEGDGWNELTGLNPIFLDLQWRNIKDRFLSQPTGFNLTYLFSDPKHEGSLSVKVQSGLNKKENKKLIVFELSMTGNEEEKDMEKWFSDAHEFILNSFEDLTDEEIRKSVWRKK